mmetsp:Transcript_15345/g.22941  ORF Transcript_15345/g.22941 Transcript_15345/m.22941 type:complete len:96 (+) Transcript_15345:342-629(+)
MDIKLNRNILSRAVTVQNENNQAILINLVVTLRSYFVPFLFSQVGMLGIPCGRTCLTLIFIRCNDKNVLIASHSDDEIASRLPSSCDSSSDKLVH